MRDPGQQGDGDDIHTLLPPPYRLGAVDTQLISPVFLPFDIAKDRKITDNTGCLLISGACLSIHNLVIFWCLRAEILNT